MRHFFSTRIKVILTLAILLAALLALISGLSGKNVPSMLVRSALAPLRSGAGAVMQQAQQVYDYIFNYERLEAENAALREQLAQIQKEALEADALRRENERLKALADLLADLIAKYADEINFEELPDPEKFLLVRTMKESYKRYTAKRNRYLKEQISLEYVMTDS
jgi:hypothetical protein